MKTIYFTVTNDLQYDQRMQRICTSLVKAGYECILVGRLLPTSIALPIFKFKTKRLKCYFNKGKLFYVEYNLRLLFFLLSKKAWAICAIDLDTLFPATIVCLLKRNKLVYDAHEYFTEVPEVVNRKFVKAIWERVAKNCIPKANLCYTVGPKLAEILGSKYKNSFSVVRNVPILKNNLKFQIHQTESNKSKSIQLLDSIKDLDKFILYQGALNDGRGLEELIKASKALNVAIVIAGEGDLSNSLREMAFDIGANNVHFLGFVKPTDLKLITEKAWLGYNLLAHKGLSYYYSLANKFFDYANAGVPCLNSNFPEYAAINHKYNCSLLIDLNTESITRVVNSLLNDDKEYERLSWNSKKVSEILNWENEEKKLIELYAQL